MLQNIIHRYKILSGARSKRYGRAFSRICCFLGKIASRTNSRDNRIATFMIFVLVPLLTLCGCQNPQDNQNHQAHNIDYKSSLDSSDKDKSELSDLPIEDLLGSLSRANSNQVFLLDLTIPAKDSTSSTHKPILLFFGSPFCAPCKHIIQNIAESKALQEVLKSHYQAYFINILSKESLQINLPSLIKKTQQKTTQKSAQKITPQSLAEFLITKKSLAHTLNIRATPTLLFLDDNGEEIFRFVGGLSKEHLLIALDFLKSPPTSNNQQQIALELHKRFLAQNK